MNTLSPQTVFGVVGGDFRQAAIAKRLSEQGFAVKAFCLERLPQFLPSSLRCTDLAKLCECDIVILPLPLSVNGSEVNTPLSDRTLSLSDCLSACRRDALIFGGKVSLELQQLANSFGLVVHDYLEREEMAVLNAVPTAEGAVELALSERATTLWESRCLITGFGRCAKTLALLLKGFGAKVTIAARKEGDLAFARTLGFQTVPIAELVSALPEQEIIFNTVPQLIFDCDTLKSVSSDCLMIDLASRPGGIAFDTAREQGFKVIWALSLPGKIAPITAGNIICDTILHMVKQISASSVN